MPFPKRIGLLLAASLVASCLAFLIVTLDSGKMNVEAQAEPQRERQVENKIPKHVPITIKLKREKEKAFKDLKNEKWLQDFELEVTNTSNKSIYFLELFVVLPEILAEDGHSVAIPLRYGRVDFVDFDTMAMPSDQPIPPGETLTFTIPEGNQRGWSWHKTKENRSDPTKVEIVFVQLSHGDGSGFNGTSATPYTHKEKRLDVVRKQSNMSPLTGSCRPHHRMSPVVSLRKSGLASLQERNPS